MTVEAAADVIAAAAQASPHWGPNHRPTAEEVLVIAHALADAGLLRTEADDTNKAIAERVRSVHPNPGDSKGVYWCVDIEAFPDQTWDAQDLLYYLLDGAASVQRSSGWTRHGHRIRGLPQVGERPPVHRCGGPAMCEQCALDSATARGGES